MRGLARDGTRWPSGARSHPSQTDQVAGEVTPRLSLGVESIDSFELCRTGMVSG